ncbi:glycosyltransferase [Streptomyces sp. NPDC004787]|uniref:glycosyltransferase n=1 Tax=Streptomyces sp. NPDC004787 TaxID=3154291 RepID=UPI0033B24B3D
MTSLPRTPRTPRTTRTSGTGAGAPLPHRTPATAPGLAWTPATARTPHPGTTVPGEGLAIALVSEHASPLAVLGGVDAGGQNVHVAQLAGSLADRGHRVTVYTRRDDPALDVTVPLRPGVLVHHVPAGPAAPLPKDELLPHMAPFARYLAEQWYDEPPDVLHAHFWMSGLAGLWATERIRVPFLHTYHALGTVKRRHQGDADTSPPTRISWERRVGLGCDRIVATCRDEVEELAAMGIPRSKTDIVPCGVDPTVFRPDGPVAPRGPYRHRLLHLGRLVPRKGAAVSVEALRLLPGTELVIAGGPPPDVLDTDPEVRRLRALAEDTGVADRVRFTGAVPRPAVPALMRSADVILCPADYEPFGIVPLEAMACGRPLVASAVGGQLDSVVHGVTGLHVPPGRPRPLAAAVRLLLADPALRARYGAAGRQRVLRRFSWASVAAATEESYRAVMAASHAPAAGAR